MSCRPCVVNGKASYSGSSLCWRSCLRLVAAAANMWMLAYIYATYLVNVDWSAFGLEEGNSAPFFECIRRLEIPAALKMLDAFTFSEAMLSQLDLYFAVGGPVTLVYTILEFSRVRWLQALLKERLPISKAHRASRWLQVYLFAITVAFLAVLLLSWFHLGFPVEHYCIAGTGFSCGCMSICIYLAAPIDFEALGEAARNAGEQGLQRWAWRVQYCVRPMLKVVVALHLAAVVAGSWKFMCVGDDRAELLFGVLETSVILGYQVFQVMFAVDDAMVGYSRPPAYSSFGLRRRYSWPVAVAAVAAITERHSGIRVQVRRTSFDVMCRDVLAENRTISISRSNPKPSPYGGAVLNLISFSLPSWRGFLRLSAASANFAMLAYIYLEYLAAVHWERFGNIGAPASALSYEELEANAEILSTFTFSHAMLQKLDLYLFVGSPATATFLFLERSRVRWLQGMLREKLPMCEASRPVRLLDLYLRAISAGFCLVMLLVPFHLGRPKAHFVCAGSAFACGCASICIHLALPIDYAALRRLAAAACDETLAQWAQRVQWHVRPVMKFVLWLHVAAAVAAVWKATNLGDDSKALAFGIMETSVILGYQLVQAMFAIDDDMVGFAYDQIGVQDSKPMPISGRRESVGSDKQSAMSSLTTPHLLGSRQQQHGNSRRPFRSLQGKRA